MTEVACERPLFYFLRSDDLVQNVLDKEFLYYVDFIVHPSTINFII